MRHRFPSPPNPSGKPIQPREWRGCHTMSLDLHLVSFSVNRCVYTIHLHDSAPSRQPLKASKVPALWSQRRGCHSKQRTCLKPRLTTKTKDRRLTGRILILTHLLLSTVCSWWLGLASLHGAFSLLTANRVIILNLGAMYWHEFDTVVPGRAIGSYLTQQ